MTTALATPKQATATERNALTQRDEFSGELQPTSAEATAQHEIQSALIIARKFPRNEDQAYGKLIKACQRFKFAEDVCYAFPRAGQTVSGPSVYLAREFARAWGNIRHGCDVVQDDDKNRTIRAWAWDLETNVKVQSDVSFAKLIYRKHGGWQKPDERDLRELTNKHAAIAKRNCLLELFPSDMVDDAVQEAAKTVEAGVAKDPDAARKNIIKSFQAVGVTADQLTAYLKHPLGQCSPVELTKLRTIWKSIHDGNSSWADYLPQAEQKSEANKTATENVSDRLKGNHAPAAGTTEGAPPAPTAPRAPAREVGDEPPEPIAAEIAEEDAKQQLADELKQAIGEAETEKVMYEIGTHLAKAREYLGEFRYLSVTEVYQAKYRKLTKKK